MKGSSNNLYELAPRRRKSITAFATLSQAQALSATQFARQVLQWEHEKRMPPPLNLLGVPAMLIAPVIGDSTSDERSEEEKRTSGPVPTRWHESAKNSKRALH